jgi:hypothetical protein
MLVSLEPPLVFLLLFGGYAVSGPAQWYWRRRRRGERRPRNDAGERPRDEPFDE